MSFPFKHPSQSEMKYKINPTLVIGSQWCSVEFLNNYFEDKDDGNTSWSAIIVVEEISGVGHRSFTPQILHKWHQTYEIFTQNTKRLIQDFENSACYNTILWNVLFQM